MGCPVGIDIPTFIKLIEIGDYVQSVRKIKETNSLPAICGRVCPQEVQCEETCNIKKAKGEGVKIGNLERFVSDYESLQGEVISLESSQQQVRKWLLSELGQQA